MIFFLFVTHGTKFFVQILLLDILRYIKSGDSPMMLRARAGRSHLGLKSSLQANFMRNLSVGAIANLATFKTSDIYRDG
ncbi:MAG: hypothetical protein EAZ59_10215 [Oscillatoriales cyanobacterium]|nr:MAG: hypothetical protein EAZ59_10215 [Oscillatoriales cyanobacterium]